MYAKLIFKNAKRSVKDYLIYIVTMTLCVTLFYAFLSISSTHYHPTIGAEYNISLLAGGMKLAICGISLLLLFLIHYVNRFMLRKKQKEFAVEATLGMEQKTIGLLFFGETFFLLIFSVSVGILLGMIVSQVITAMLLASFGEPYAFSWSFFPDTVLLTVGFFVICQILVGVGNVRILNKSRIIELMTANRQNEKPLHKSRWMPMICIIYGIMLLWMLEVGAVKYHFYFDPRHPLPVKLMYWGNVLFPALTLLWAIAGAVLHRKIGFSRYLCGLLAGAVLTAIPIFSIAELEKAYFLGFDAPTLNQYLLFGVADILFIISRPIDVSKFGVLYAGAQKNMAPAGLTVVIVREDLIGNAMDITPTMLNWKTHADNGSMFNTPPCYTIYIAKLVLEWIKNEVGGLDKMYEINKKKADLLYGFLDSSELFKGTVVPEDRSLMNVPFVTGDADLDAKFVKEATENGLVNIKGHRTVGGMRASIYNAMPYEGVEKLVEFMKKFEAENK